MTAIKLSGMIDLEIEIPDAMINKFTAALRDVQPVETAKPDQPETSAYPDTANGWQARVVADFLREAAADGVTETEIKNRFSAIRSNEHLASVLGLLPSLLYRKSDGKPPRWSYYYQN